MENIEKLCQSYHLGKLKGEPEMITGGLMHRMYHVSTDQGEYAVKLLNPDIMKRPEALQNMINSETVSNALKDVVPLVAAKCFDGKCIIELDGSFYVIFDWIEGKSNFVPDILEHHCAQVGRVLGKIHTANIKVDSIEKNHGIRGEYDWKMLFEKAKQCNAECCSVLQENLVDIMRWDNHVVSALSEVSQDQVISHRDLDPKNIMWNNDELYIIDWEAAGYVNPFQELDIGNVNWDAVMACSFDGMLGWLEYSIKRALGMEGSEAKDRQEGMQQTKGTILELKKYENQIEQLKEWMMCCTLDMKRRK